MHIFYQCILQWLCTHHLRCSGLHPWINPADLKNREDRSEAMEESQAFVTQSFVLFKHIYGHCWLKACGLCFRLNSFLRSGCLDHPRPRPVLWWRDPWDKRWDGQTCFMDLSVRVFGGYQSGYFRELVVNSHKHSCFCQHLRTDVFLWLKGGLFELLMLSSSTNRACIDQQSLE